MIKSKDEPATRAAPPLSAVPSTYQQAGTPGSGKTTATAGRTQERSHPTPPDVGQGSCSQQGNTAAAERRHHRPASARPSLREHRQAAGRISRQRVNDAYHRAYSVPGAGFPKTRSPHQFRTLEIAEPSIHHIKFRKSGVAEIHIKGLPILCFNTDHRINVLN